MEAIEKGVSAMSRIAILCLMSGLALAALPAVAEAQPTGNTPMLRGQPLGSLPVPRFRPNPQPLPITPAGRFVDAAVGGPFLFGGGQSVVVQNGGVAIPREITLNINTVPTVMGIARPPAAAPVIYVIGGEGRRERAERRGEMRRMAAADVTTPRIIRVPGR
jgi:hypothetical protein